MIAFNRSVLDYTGRSFRVSAPWNGNVINILPLIVPVLESFSIFIFLGFFSLFQNPGGPPAKACHFPPRNAFAQLAPLDGDLHLRSVAKITGIFLPSRSFQAPSWLRTSRVPRAPRTPLNSAVNFWIFFFLSMWVRIDDVDTAGYSRPTVMFDAPQVTRFLPSPLFRGLNQNFWGSHPSS